MASVVQVVFRTLYRGELQRNTVQCTIPRPTHFSIKSVENARSAALCNDAHTLQSVCYTRIV